MPPLPGLEGVAAIARLGQELGWRQDAGDELQLAEVLRGEFRGRGSYKEQSLNYLTCPTLDRFLQKNLDIRSLWDLGCTHLQVV
jgi:hypothetical protein